MHNIPMLISISIILLLSFNIIIIILFIFFFFWKARGRKYTPLHPPCGAHECHELNAKRIYNITLFWNRLNFNNIFILYTQYVWKILLLKFLARFMTNLFQMDKRWMLGFIWKWWSAWCTVFVFNLTWIYHHLDSWTHLHDNTAHIATLLTCFYSENQITILSYPPYFLDLNPYRLFFISKAQAEKSLFWHYRNPKTFYRVVKGSSTKLVLQSVWKALLAM